MTTPDSHAAAIRSFRHWVWRLTRKRVRDACDGSPFRLCDSCTTPAYCRNRP